VAMEACGSAHHWGRQLVALGHEVKLIPPAHVKPYVRRNKTDAADAAACLTRRRCASVSGSSLCVRSTTRPR
jgi:transposase